MSTTSAGHYPIEHRDGEIERLEAQGITFAPDARIDARPHRRRAGWTCLDLGCGPRGITDLMSERVGPTGRVIGVDRDEKSLAYATAHAAANVEFRHGDVYETGLPDATFDLVHMRFVASTSGDPERLLREAMRLARPGGVVALQEPDAETYACYPPHPSFDRLMAAMLGAFTGTSDVYLARRLYQMVRRRGPDRRALPSGPDRHPLHRSDDRSPAVHGGIVARHDPETRIAVGSGVSGLARAMPQPLARSGNGASVLHGRAGLGPQAGLGLQSSDNRRMLSRASRRCAPCSFV